ncbi:MAG: hypothetical protein ACOZBZ_03395 [Patescibacteria group bacterium]
MKKIKIIRKIKKAKSSEAKEDFSKVDWEKAAKIFQQDKDSLEKKLQRLNERYPYVKEILYLLAAGSFLTLAVVMPNLPMALAPLLKSWQGYQRKRLKENFDRLRKQKLVEIVEENGQQVVKITEKGRVKALRYKLEEMAIKKPKRWDRKWRIVIFDIPEKNKRFRDSFREKIKNLEFYQLQESVFVHPFPCFDQVEFLRQVYNVRVEVTYIVAEKIENQENLRSHFNL